MAEDEGVLIGNYMSNQLITATLNIGMSEPLYCTALGKALLCGQSESERERLIGKIRYQMRTPKTIVDEEKFRFEIKQTIERGAAIDDEEYSLDLRCVAAPIFTSQGKVIAAVGISGPISRMRTEVLPSIIKTVREIAEEISRAVAL